MIDFGESPSLQLRVLGFCLLIEGDISVSVFPEGEEVFVGGQRSHASGIGVSALRSFGLQGIGTSHAQMRQRSRPAVQDNTAVVDDFLKIGGGSTALSGCQVCLTPNVLASSRSSPIFP
jgi:hypothetical protein